MPCVQQYAELTGQGSKPAPPVKAAEEPKGAPAGPSAFSLPKFDVPKFDVPKFDVPKFDVPKARPLGQMHCSGLCAVDVYRLLALDPEGRAVWVSG